MIRRADLEYRTPPGYVDESFIYVFNADALVDGAATVYLNLAVDVPDTDFILRKLDGALTVLIPLVGPLGRYQVRDKNQQELFQRPLYVGVGPGASRAVLPEIIYPRGSQIGFDLYAVTKFYNVTAGSGGMTVPMSQMLFWGAKRRQGTRKDSNYRYRLVPYSYTTRLTIDWNTYIYAAGVPIGPEALRTFSVQINNLDFELWGLVVTDPATGFCAASLAKMLLYDQAGLARMSNPVLVDLFAEIPAGPFFFPASNSFGKAISPPILYQVGSQIKFDIQSMAFAADIPVIRDYTFFGAQRLPAR